MKNKNTSRVFMVLSMLLFGTLAPFVRKIGVASGELALYRAVLAAALVGGFLLVTGQKISLTSVKKELLLLFLSGGAMGINWILLFQAYKYTTVSVATLSYYFAPVLVTVLSPVLFREKLTAKGILCFVMSTTGLVLITGTAGGGGENPLGICFGLGAAVFYAAVMILNKYIRGVTGLQRTFVQLVAAIVVLLPYVVASGGFTLHRVDTTGWINLLIVGLLHTGVAYCMYFSALGVLPGQTTAMLSYLDPLVAVLISVLWLGESLNVLQVIGGVLILGFTLYSELSPGRKPDIKNG